MTAHPYRFDYAALCQFLYGGLRRFERQGVTLAEPVLVYAFEGIGRCRVLLQIAADRSDGKIAWFGAHIVFLITQSVNCPMGRFLARLQPAVSTLPFLPSCRGAP